MHSQTVRVVAGWALVMALGASTARAQWDDRFNLAGVDEFDTLARVRALAVHDDGTGPALFVGGEFVHAGGTPVNNVARWDGSAWNDLGGGTGAPVKAFASFDDGTGPALYSAGAGVARWDGSSWSPVGVFIPIQRYDALAVFDDGSGAALYVGGKDQVGSGPSVARWDGSQWSTVGSLDGIVTAFSVFDDGSGPALYATSNGDATTGDRVMKWDGATWTQVGGTFDDNLLALAVFDDGGGPRLAAGGAFTQVGGTFANHVAVWDGTAWQQLGSIGIARDVRSLLPFDDGSGPALYATGAPGAGNNGVLRWNGAVWTVVGGTTETINGWALAAHDDGSGPKLYVGGDFLSEPDSSFPPARDLVAWDGVGWSRVGPGEGVHGEQVLVLEAVEDLGGTALYAGGDFRWAGGVPARNLARWDGLSWSALGDGPSAPVAAVAVFDDGSGPALHAGTERWDGTSWSPTPGLQASSTVRVLKTIDDGSGPRLYAGGSLVLSGMPGTVHIARWDGSTWSVVGGDVEYDVASLAVFDDGGGPAVYAGLFLPGGPVPGMVRRLDGSTWTDIDGPTANVLALEVYDDGNGPALFAGGSFNVTASGVPVSDVARWDGSSWSAVGAPPIGVVRALTVHDEGAGPRLFAAGNQLAAWDGTSWTPLGSFAGGSGGPAHAVEGFDGHGTAVYVAGSFTHVFTSGAGWRPSHRIARWGEPVPDGPQTHCVGKTNSLGCVPFLTFTGVPSASATSPFRIVGNDVVPNEFGLLVYGFAKANLSFHNGKLCVKTPLTRLLPPKGSGNAAAAPCTGELATNFNKRIQSGADPSLTVGAFVAAQWRYRDPGVDAFNDGLTDGISFLIQP